MKGKPTDCANHLPSLKAGLDGVIDASILKDDSPQYVKSILFWAPEKVGEDYLSITIRET